MTTQLDPDGRIELAIEGARPGLGAAVDFRRVSLRGLSSQRLVRACGPRGVLLDATAGLGGDSWILAAAGFSVVAVERSSLVCTVLRDGLARARAVASLAPIAARIELHEGNAVDVMATSAAPWSVIYLDPMYPTKAGSALAPKPIRLVREVVGSDRDSDELFAAAVATRCPRIVVKRPHHAPPLAANPDAVFESKLARYDAYFLHGESLRAFCGGRRA